MNCRAKSSGVAGCRATITGAAMGHKATGNACRARAGDDGARIGQTSGAKPAASGESPPGAARCTLTWRGVG